MTYLIFTLALVYVPYSTTSFFPNCVASASQYAAANSLLVHCIQREEGRPVFVDLTSYIIQNPTVYASHAVQSLSSQ